MSIKGVVEGLAPINCFYNHKPLESGKCFSRECMFNQDPKIKEDIQKNGCELYRKIKRVEGHYVFVQ